MLYVCLFLVISQLQDNVQGIGGLVEHLDNDGKLERAMLIYLKLLKKRPRPKKTLNKQEMEMLMFWYKNFKMKQQVKHEETSPEYWYTRQGR